MAVRWVVVDDTDPEIQYVGPWLKGYGQTDSLGNFGPPFQETSHGAEGDASISYMFTGSRVRALGTCEVSDFYQWECFVDNISIGSAPPTDNPENNWILCDSNSLVDGPHNFTLRVTYYGHVFWFDQIQYVPSRGMALNSSLVLVNASDSAIQYAGWQDMGRIVAWDMSYYTTLPNRLANMTFDFNGTSLKWFTLCLNDTSLISTGSSYLIDGAESAFALEPTTSGPVLYNRLAFEVSNLSAGPHQLSVSHSGQDRSIPLTLNYLIIQNRPPLVGATSTSASISISSLPSSSSSPSNPGGFNSSSPTVAKSKGSPTGAIGGGAIGGVILVVAIILLLLLRWQRGRNADQGLNQEETLPNNIAPFDTPPTAPVSFRKISAGGQLQSSPSAVPTGHVPQYPSKFRMIPTGPRPLTSPNALSSQSSGSPENHNSTTGNSRPREADESRELSSTNLLSVQPEIPVASNSHSSNTAAPQHVMRHEDSGVRLPPRESMIELPPMYTAL